MDITIDALRAIQPDPVLSGFALGTPPGNFVADRLFKAATPAASAINIYDWGKQGLKPLAGTLVTDHTTKIASFGIDAPTKSLIQVEPHAMSVPFNAFTVDKAMEAESGAIDLISKKIQTLTGQWLTTKESFAAALMASTAVFAAGFSNITDIASAKWSASDGKPVDDVDVAKEKVALRTGMIPNKMLISFSALNALKKNAQITGLNPANQEGVTTLKQLQEYLELDEIIVTASIANSARKGKADSLDWLWPKTDAILYYEAPVLNDETRTFALNVPWSKWLGLQGWLDQRDRLIGTYTQVECLRYVVVDNLCAEKLTNVI